MRHALLCFGVVPIIVAASIIGLSAQATDGKVQPWDNVTWKVNVAKSKYNPASLAPKSTVAKRESMEGGGFRNTNDTVDGTGKATHAVTVAKYDGKDNPRQGAQPPGQTQAYRLIDGGYEIVLTLAGKVMTTSRFQLSRDGKTLTQTVTGNDVQTGQSVNHTVIWERQ
jgi:hypothetical protein